MLVNNFINNKISYSQPYAKPRYSFNTQNFRGNQIQQKLLNETRGLVRQYYEALYKTFFNNNSLKNVLQPKNIPESILNNIASSELEKINKVPIGYKLKIITGRLGSGKTTFVDNEQLKKNFYVPDSDELKPLLPGFRDKGAYYVHEASYIINKMNLFEAFKHGVNCVFQTATDPHHLDEIIQKAQEYGYQDIKLIHMNVTEQNAIERCNLRSNSNGRVIHPNIIKERKYIDDIVEIYSNPLKGISEIFVYDNNNSKPLLMEHLIIK